MRNIEDLLQDLGGNGIAQIVIIVLTNLPRMSLGWSMLEMSFANFVPQWCCLPDNVTDSPELYCRQDGSFNLTFGKTCVMNSTSCSRRVFATSERTVVNEWDLVCDRKWIVPLATSIQMAGVLVGASLGGQMADLWGRKKIVFVNAAFSAVFNIVSGFSNRWQMFIALRFFIGVTVGGFLAVCTPYTTEFVTPSKRALVSLIPTFNTGGILMACLAWLVKDWRMVHWIGGAATIPLLVGYFIIPESLRWLAVQGRIEEADKVIQWIARWNKKEIPKDSLDIVKRIAADVESTRKDKKYTYIHIYKGWHLFKTSIILQGLWCIASMCSYGLSFGASAMGDNVYMNICLLQLATFPGVVVLGLILDRFGRRKTGIVSYVLSSVCAFTSLAVTLTVSDKTTKDHVNLALNLLGRAIQAAASSSMMLTTTEVYPTVIRALGFGAANVTARIGGIVAPFALNFEDNPTLAFVLMAGSLLASAVAVVFLEETTGKAMQDVALAVTKAGDVKESDGRLPEIRDETEGNNNKVCGQNGDSNTFTSDDLERGEKGVWHISGDRLKPDGAIDSVIELLTVFDDSITVTTNTRL